MAFAIALTPKIIRSVRLNVNNNKVRDPTQVKYNTIWSNNKTDHTGNDLPNKSYRFHANILHSGEYHSYIR